MNQTFTKPKNELTFTKNYTSITACTKLTALEKLLIARVLSWQQNNLICTQSNNALAKALGESLSTLKRTITKLNKTTFFFSKETSHFNEFGSWTNSKEIIIDEKLLDEFISLHSKENITVVSNDNINAEQEQFETLIQPEIVLESVQQDNYDIDVELEDSTLAEDLSQDPIELKTYDMIKIFEPFVKNEDDSISDLKFDKLMDILDIIKKGFNSGSNNLTSEKLSIVHSLLVNQTDTLSDEEIQELQEIIIDNLQFA